MAGYGTGSPMYFHCAKFTRLSFRERDITREPHTVTLTGRTKPRPHDGRRGPRSTDTYREYKCSCGHVGWSAHIDLAKRAGEGKDTR